MLERKKERSVTGSICACVLMFMPMCVFVVCLCVYGFVALSGGKGGARGEERECGGDGGEGGGGKYNFVCCDPVPAASH